MLMRIMVFTLIRRHALGIGVIFVGLMVPVIHVIYVIYVILAVVGVLFGLLYTCLGHIIRVGLCMVMGRTIIRFILRGPLCLGLVCIMLWLLPVQRGNRATGVVIRAVTIRFPLVLSIPDHGFQLGNLCFQIAAHNIGRLIRGRGFRIFLRHGVGRRFCIMPIRQPERRGKGHSVICLIFVIRLILRTFLIWRSS